MENEAKMPVDKVRKLALNAIIDGAKAERERTMSAILQIKNIAYANSQKAVVLAMDTLVAIIQDNKLEDMRKQVNDG